MMNFVALVATCVVVGTSAAEEYGPEALQDEIHDLPGAPKVTWRMFSGYIDVSAPNEKAGTRQMFYWFVESQADPKKDPVMLWTNGGPGCTGLGGFLSEQGPFRAADGGKSLKINEFTWTKLANMVFIEQPVGVGFSTTQVSINYGDEQAATDNYRFVKGFFKRFPQYASQDFYISSESYGGHYMPTLAQKIKMEADVPQFRGVFLGNPLTYMMYRNYGQYGTAWGHQLLPQPLWIRYERAQCATNFPPSDACGNITNEMDAILAGFDPYALDFDKCNSPGVAAGRHERWTLHHAMLRARGELQAPTPYEPCIENFFTAYLNRPDVQSQIHVKPGAKWEMCSNAVSNAYNISDVNAPMMHVWEDLLKKGDLNILILSGDDDSVCATLGTQQFVWSLGYPPKAGQNWSPWEVDGQVAGFKTEFEVPNKNGLGAFTFATVHGAGHMVPATQPARSLALLKSFLGRSSGPTKSIVV
jgi:carboxypeptidase C (cathepsin A)